MGLHVANYTAADIKALRERTGAGMMDVKKALDEANGDADKAVELIRIKGLKGATKREGRSTSEGLVAAKVIDGTVGVMIELSCVIAESVVSIHEVASVTFWANCSFSARLVLYFRLRTARTGSSEGRWIALPSDSCS